MVTYTYKCINEECEIFDIQFDVRQSMHDDKLTTCPECAKETLQKVISSAPAFRSVVNGLNRFRPSVKTDK